MSHKKQKKIQSAVAADGVEAAKPAERKPTKKEKKAAEEQRRKELATIRKRYFFAAMIVAGAAVAVNFAANPYYGQPIYEWIVAGCFLLMGISGGIFMFASRYEETERQQSNKHTMGLVFVVISLGMILSQIIKILIQ